MRQGWTKGGWGWTRVDTGEGGWEWMRVDEGRWGWMRVDEGGWGWMKVDEGGWGWTRVERYVGRSRGPGRVRWSPTAAGTRMVRGIARPLPPGTRMERGMSVLGVTGTRKGELWFSRLLNSNNSVIAKFPPPKQLDLHRKCNCVCQWIVFTEKSQIRHLCFSIWFRPK